MTIMDFRADDVVRHRTGVTGTLLESTTHDAWWATDERGEHRWWLERHIILVERPYPGSFDHVMTDVDIDEGPAPVWAYVLIGAALVLCVGLLVLLVRWL